MVSRKIKNRLKRHIKRSCKYKKQYNLFIGMFKLLFLKIKNNGNPSLYNCQFCNFYHLGNIHKRTLQKTRYFKNVSTKIQIDKELKILGVKQLINRN